jgi:hypothetical protein
MPTVLELQARLDDLRKARATGALAVRHADGRMVTYRGDAEMASAAADLERQITLASGVPISTVLVSSSKGFDA